MTADQFLLELYKEEQTHARHTETQRLEVTKFLLLIVGALVGFMGTLKFSIYCLPFGILIVSLGFIGRTVTSTYIKRFDDHRTRARAFRTRIDEMVTPAGIARPILKEHPMTKPNNDRVRTFWIKINNGVIVLGFVCLLCNLSAVMVRARANTSGRSMGTRIIEELALPDK